MLFCGASLRTTWLIAIAAIFAYSETALAASPDPKQGGQISVQCAACHGNFGISVDTTIPNLAGQHFAYLLEQLNAFKQKTRINPIMNEIVGLLSQEQIDDLAAYYASIPIRTDKVSSPKK